MNGVQTCALPIYVHNCRKERRSISVNDRSRMAQVPPRIEHADESKWHFIGGSDTAVLCGSFIVESLSFRALLTLVGYDSDGENRRWRRHADDFRFGGFGELLGSFFCVVFGRLKFLDSG